MHLNGTHTYFYACVCENKRFCSNFVPVLFCNALGYFCSGYVGLELLKSGLCLGFQLSETPVYSRKKILVPKHLGERDLHD